MYIKFHNAIGLHATIYLKILYVNKYLYGTSILQLMPWYVSFIDPVFLNSRLTSIDFDSVERDSAVVAVLRAEALQIPSKQPIAALKKPAPKLIEKVDYTYKSIILNKIFLNMRYNRTNFNHTVLNIILVMRFTLVYINYNFFYSIENIVLYFLFWWQT